MEIPTGAANEKHSGAYIGWDMDLERIVIFIFALFYGVWGLLLISHSLLQMREKQKKSNLTEKEAPTTASLDNDEAKNLALHK